MQHLLERVQDAYGPHPPGEFWVPHRLGGGAPTLAEANRMDAEEAAEKAAPPRANGPTPPGRRGSGYGAGLPHAGDRGQGRRSGPPGHAITYHGLENIPATGGAVIAINHTSYVDFLPAALAAHHRKRRMRFMIKAEMQEVKFVSFLIKHSKTIPVDRRAGAARMRSRCERLRDGELVGVYPEATISRSFELKEFKTGAARMALEAQVPIVPLIVWGAQRMWTKDHPKSLGRNKIPITVSVGAPIPPTGHHRAARRRAARGDDDAAAQGAAGLPASRGRVLGAAPARRLRTDDGGGQGARRGGAGRAGAQAGRA